MLKRPDTWSHAHALFDRIRTKTLRAEDSGNTSLSCQYLFEEICAKTLYNLTFPDDPFDSDSCYWIIPIAIGFARSVGLQDADVITIVAA